MDKSNRRSDTQLIKKAERLSRLFVALHKVNSDMATQYMSQFRHLLENKGRKGLCSVMKQYKLQITQIVLKQDVSPIPYTKCNEKGISLFVNKLLRYVNLEDIQHLRCLVSLSRIAELVTLQPTYDYSTITDRLTPESEKYILSVLPEFVKFLERWKPIQRLPNIRQVQFPMKNATGPNTSKVLPYGASILAFYDFTAIKDEEFFHSVKAMLAMQNIDISHYDVKQGRYSHSKIVSLQDKFGKERIIAIGDVISNWAVSPLEVNFQKGLSSMRCSVAYKQSVVPDLIRGLGPHLYSADLSAFTDRFPRQLQKAVVSARYGSTVGNHWETILTKRTFESKRGPISYEVGNPMGFLSSWSVSTMTHHAFIEFLGSKYGINKVYDKYIMLGDDIVIADEELYKKYIENIQKLGIPISHSKCTISKTGYTEFAKRLFTPKGEITGFPVNQTLKGLENPIHMIGLMKTLSDRGYSFTDTTWDYDLLHTSCRKGTRKSLDWARTLPLNHFDLPDGVWVGTNEKCMTLDELSIRLNIITAGEIERLGNSIKEVHSLIAPDGNSLIPEYHPILTNIGNKVHQIFMMDPDGFQVWESWNTNELRISIPSAKPQTENILRRQKFQRLDFALRSVKIPQDGSDPALNKLTNMEVALMCFPS
jgi:hypothetical protein